MTTGQCKIKKKKKKKINNFRRFGERQIEVRINWREREEISVWDSVTEPQQGR